jgi:1-acyl-sn-glycerol-3-phosphate acyltransferase
MRRIENIGYSLLIWSCGLLLFCVWSLFLLLVGIFHTGRFFEACLKGLARVLVWFCGIRVTVTGRENFVCGRQYILMMNHVNMLDGFVFYRCFPGQARGVEEESHFRWPIYGWVIRRMGQIPISRKSGARALESLQRAADLIRRKRDFSFMVLPEGTRTVDGKLGPFKKGGFLLALETGLNILPLVQKGSYQINRKNSLLIRPGRVEYFIEKPIAVADYSRQNLSELMEKVRSVFLKYVE